MFLDPFRASGNQLSHLKALPPSFLFLPFHLPLSSSYFLSLHLHHHYVCTVGWPSTLDALSLSPPPPLLLVGRGHKI